MAPTLLLGFVGDTFVNRDQPLEPFRQVRDLLGGADVMFANLESTYTDRPEPVPSGLYMMHGPAHALDVFSEVGFTVVSLANNHILDCGYQAMLDTRARLRAQGVATCGIGDDLQDARAPARVAVGGRSIAFLGYSSVFPVGYEARVDRPGLAPMRAHNLWRDPNPVLLEPGRVPVVETVPDQVDLAHLAQDIHEACARADLVIASFHWGDQMRPYRLTDHEKRIARFCIDQGAHMVVGHGAHAIRGMEWYSGRPILYGLGHFVFDLKLPWTAEEYAAWLAEVDPDGWTSSAPYQMGAREGWPYLPMHEDMRMTLYAWAEVEGGEVSAIGFVPCMLDPDGSVRPVDIGSAEGRKVQDYFAACNATQRLNGVAIDAGRSIAGHRALRIVPLQRELSGSSKEPGGA